VKCGGALEIQLFAGFLALFFDGGTQGAATGLQELYQALDFEVVVFLGAARKTGRKAHFHFRVQAAGKRGIAADFDLATADFE
jgi:hypothetical protein